MRTLIAVLAAVTMTACSQATRPVDLLITNARVFTGNAAMPFAQSVAVRGTRIAAVGTNQQLQDFAPNAKRVFDAGGRLVVPGINDAHVHQPTSGRPDNIELPPTASAEDVLAAVRDATAKYPAGTWLRGTLPVPLITDASMTRDALDAVSPNHRVIFEILSGHAGLLNSPALAAWSIGDTTPDPKGGWYARSGGHGPHRRGDRSTVAPAHLR